ncbi:hypothetical protein GALL_50120 [mine drainage metagenome]|uniref:Uncharacterized protein n=1 Tax=mine drainage metagenome TaxID=410659 RepID=A0A1J5TJI8_9ZZZZ
MNPPDRQTIRRQAANAGPVSMQHQKAGEDLQ